MDGDSHSHLAVPSVGIMGCDVRISFLLDITGCGASVEIYYYNPAVDVMMNEK